VADPQLGSVVLPNEMLRFGEGRLGNRYAAIADQSHRLKLERANFLLCIDDLRSVKPPYLGVHQTGSRPPFRSQMGDGAASESTAFTFNMPRHREETVCFGKVAPTQDAAENCIFIADFKTSADGKTCQLLINRGDPDVAHPSFINPAALTVKNVPPGPDEVQGWSAHMVLNLTSDATGNHRAAFERMQNVSSTLVQRYLDALLDQATEGDAKYTYEKALKRGKKTVIETRPYKLRLGINKVPSENLLEDVKTGSLTAITLIRREPQYSGPGDPTVVNSVKERLVIRTKKLEKDKALDYIKDVTQWGST